MSDKQTTAIVLLVILALLFYLYNAGRLGNLVSVITGSQINPNLNITHQAAYMASNAQVSADASYSTNQAQGLNTGYFLNAVYGINQGTGVVQYGPPSSNSGTNAISQDLGTVASLLSVF